MRIDDQSEIEELRALARTAREKLQTALAECVSDEDEPPLLIEELAEHLAVIAEIERRLGRMVAG